MTDTEDYAVGAGAPTEAVCEGLFPGSDVHGSNAALSFLIPRACYDGTKNAIASDTLLVAGNIKNAVTIFGVPGTHAPLIGDDVLGDDGALVIAIPAVNYPAGKHATAQDSFLIVGNIKSGVTIFGILGTYAPLSGDDVAGDNGVLAIAIPAANYPAGKHATASDTLLVVGNIKSGVTIFGVLGTYAPLSGDNVAGDNGALVVAIPAANYPAGKHTTASDTLLVADNIKDSVTIFGITGSLVGAIIHSLYPILFTDTYVLATSILSANFAAFLTTNPTLLLTGSWNDCQWLSNSIITNQRFHIALYSSKIVKRIYYENAHAGPYLGYNTVGAKNFTFWGSNSATAFADLVYSHDTDWTQITTAQSTFDKHVNADQADPKYIDVTNTIAYQYYAFKFADNWGSSEYMGVRRIVLQGLN